MAWKNRCKQTSTFFFYLLDANALITWCNTRSARCCKIDSFDWTAWTKAGNNSGHSLGTSYRAIFPMETAACKAIWYNGSWPKLCKKFRRISTFSASFMALKKQTKIELYSVQISFRFKSEVRNKLEFQHTLEQFFANICQCHFSGTKWLVNEHLNLDFDQQLKSEKN